MKNILFYGGDTAGVLPLCRALTGFGGVLYLGDGHICTYGDTKARFTVAAPSRLDSFAAEESVLWLSDPLPGGELGGFCVQRACAVVDESEQAVLDATRRLGISAVTFGASKGDFSLSSFDGEAASVCLSRRIVTLDGKIVPPCEIPVSVRGYCSARRLPALTAVLILCGCGESLTV